MSKSNLLVGVDIGTTKVACIVGEETEEGVDIVGIGTHPSEGLRKGGVITLAAPVTSIQKAVDGAEVRAGGALTAVFGGRAG
ncbi:MAG: cell division protein FtsA, partial [Myxococcota bacterium]|nr:cell division protein FtsA [Myxococcota bacterium]